MSNRNELVVAYLVLGCVVLVGSMAIGFILPW